MKRILNFGLVIGLLLVTGTSGANEAVNRYLGQAQDLSLFPLETVAGDSSWFDAAELRYSGNDADEQGIAFRFRPRFGSERQAANRIVELLNQQHSGKRNAYVNDELRPRYDNLVELIEMFSELRYFEARHELSRQQLQLQRALVESADFRLSALQAAEIEYQRTRQLTEVYQARLSRRLLTFDGISPTRIQNFLQTWMSQVVDWNEIIDVGLQLSQAFEDGQIDDPLQRTDAEIARQKLKLARHDAASWLKFVELKYVDRPGDQETSFSVAIPLGGDDNGIAQRAAEVNETSLSLQQKRLDTERQLTLATREIVWLRDQADLLVSTRGLLERQFAALRSASQPALLLDLKKAQLDNQKEIDRLRIRGLGAYIGLLHDTGRLAQWPLSNWLLVNHPTL